MMLAYCDCVFLFGEVGWKASSLLYLDAVNSKVLPRGTLRRCRFCYACIRYEKSRNGPIRVYADRIILYGEINSAENIISLLPAENSFAHSTLPVTACPHCRCAACCV